MTQTSKAQQTAAVDNRAEVGAARTQRYHMLFKLTRSWQAARDVLHAEAEDGNRPALHATGQRVALGTIIDCGCPRCAATIAEIERQNLGYRIQGA